MAAQNMAGVAARRGRHAPYYSQAGYVVSNSGYLVHRRSALRLIPTARGARSLFL
jgi:hypothetical protein